ncbi:MAG: hypothetical protein GY822_25490 [Deltaproteobacteria bacterium]|nr:hypothetical protein [Deltaproteobacteria bacterium]
MTTTMILLRRWMGLCAAFVVVLFVYPALLQGCASSSDGVQSRMAPSEAQDESAHAAEEPAAHESSPQDELDRPLPGVFDENSTSTRVLLAPWNTTAFEKGSRFSTNGSTASYDHFISRVNKKNLPQKLPWVRPQEWVQAAAPTPHALRSVVEQESQPPSNVALKTKVEVLRLPTGRTFISLSWLVVPGKLQEAHSEKPDLHVVLTDSNADLEAFVDELYPDFQSVSFYAGLGEEVRRLSGRHEVLLVSSSAPNYALQDWQQWAARASKRGVEISSWIRPSEETNDVEKSIRTTKFKLGDRLVLSNWRRIAEKGTGQLWVGGENKAVLSAWKLSALSNLENPSVKFPFAEHLVKRHRVVASSSGKLGGTSPSWRKRVVYSMLVEVELLKKFMELRPHLHLGDIHISFEHAVSNDDKSFLSWNAPLEYTPSSSRKSKKRHARQVQLALLAESFHGQKPLLSDVLFLSSKFWMTSVASSSLQLWAWEHQLTSLFSSCSDEGHSQKAPLKMPNRDPELAP